MRHRVRNVCLVPCDLANSVQRTLANRSHSLRRFPSLLARVCHFEPFVIEVGLASSTHYLPWLRQLVAATGISAGGAPLSPAAVWRCTAALIEAVNNAMVHAHRRDARRRVWLRCRVEGRRVTLTVRDMGRAFTPRWDTMPSPARTTGRGLYLMRTLMDRVQYRRRNNGNEMMLIYHDIDAPSI